MLVAVLAVPTALVFVIRAFAAQPVAVDPSRSATLPAVVAGYSYLVADEAGAPMGRAVGIYQQSTGSEDDTLTKTMLVSADTNTYRMITPPPAYQASETMLSPDGRQVALVGTPDIDNGSSRHRIWLLDLGSGTWRWLPTRGEPSGLLAWSRDSRSLAYSTVPLAAADGDVALLDLTTGTDTALRWPRPGPGDPPITAAFAPDGRVAVHSNDALRIYAASGQLDRELALPATRSLAGAGAWSPDGRLLVTRVDETYGMVPHSTLEFLDVSAGASGAGAAVTPPPIDSSGLDPETPLLGWRSADEVVLAEWSDRNSADARIVVRSLRTGERTVLSTFTFDVTDSYPVQGLRLAFGLLDGVQARPDGVAHRGPWPAGAVASALAAWYAVVLSTTWVWRRVAARRRRRSEQRPLVVDSPLADAARAAP